jgi:hypothetical protein
MQRKDKNQSYDLASNRTADQYQLYRLLPSERLATTGQRQLSRQIVTRLKYTSKAPDCRAVDRARYGRVGY